MNVSPEVYARHRLSELKPLIDRFSRRLPSMLHLAHYPAAMSELEQLMDALQNRRIPEPLRSRYSEEDAEKIEASFAKLYEYKQSVLVDETKLQRLMALARLLSKEGYSVMLDERAEGEAFPLSSAELEALGLKGEPPRGGTMLVVCFEAQA